jgi:stringent starvation protein B
MQNINITSSKPYIIRGLNDWIEDNNLTTYLIVSTAYPETYVPEEHINKENQTIILNISPSSCINLDIGNDYTSFTLTFGGIPKNISFPTEAIAAIQVKETQMLIPLEMQSIEKVYELLNLDEKKKNKEQLTKKTTKKIDNTHLSIVKKKK